MIFYSVAFLIFFIVFSLLIHIAPNIKTQYVVFLLANIVFYAYWDYRFLALLFGVIVICYFGALFFSKSGNDLFVSVAIFFCIITLGVFKYFNFFVESFCKAFGIHDAVSLKFILPLGISFYLFQAISYLCDVKFGKIKAEKDFAKIAVYISFFPQITSGPIVKSKDFLHQLGYLHRLNKRNLYEGIQLFLIGLTKKIVIADRIGIAVDAVYNAPAAYNGISVLLAIVGYSLQIYCDFSGYSNMAIGIAKIWDFNLGDNFNAPYLAQNPSDFWRRWHISLSTWFRDYVYIPIGGSKKGRIRTYFNLFITMVLSGLWHGANYTYILWGIVHGIGSALHRLYKDMVNDKRIGFDIPKGISTLATYAFVSMAWVIFRSTSLENAMDIYASIFNTSGLTYLNIYTVIYVGIFFVLNIYSARKNNGNALTINLNLDIFRNKLLLAIWIWLIVLFMYCGNSAFIYAQF